MIGTPMRRLSLLPLLLTLTACGGEAAAGALATRADSAGVTIVTSHDPSWREGDGWRIDPEPALQIGPRADADPRYDLLRIRGGTVLPDGKIAVLTAGTHEIRIYDAEGTWLRSMGRTGDGPGEFRTPNGLFHAHDTLFVPDGIVSRLNLFLTDGTILPSHLFGASASGSRVAPSGRFADGTWVGVAGIRINAGADALPMNGLIRHPQDYRRLSSDLATDLGVITTMMGDERVIHTTTGAGGEVSGISIIQPRLGRSTYGATNGDRFLIGDNAIAEIRAYGTDGALRTLIRWNVPPRPITDALVATMKAAALAETDDTLQQRGIAAQFDVPLGGTTVPYFRGLWVDPTGAVWLQEFNLLPTDSLRFRIFDRDGQLLGIRALPPRHTVLEVGREHLLTVWRDADDLEYLRMYRVRR